MKLNLIKSLSCLALATCALPLTASAQLIISEVYPNGSGNGTYAADWFELRNLGPTTLDLTGWKMDDGSASFATSVAMRGVTSLAPGQTAIFLEGAADGSTDATIISAFQSAWFGASVPAGLTLGFYGGSGVGLSTGGDGVNVFDSAGTLLAGISFGAFTPGKTFDNTAGLSGLISLVSADGVNGAFVSFNGVEIGSPGVVPEPSSLALLVLSGGFLMLRRRAFR